VANRTQLHEAERRDRGDSLRDAPPRGTRGVTAILPNGRTVWLKLSPALPPAAEIRRFASITQERAQRRSLATSWTNAAVERLAQSIAEDAERLTAEKLARVRKLRRQLVARYNRLDRRVTKTTDEYRGGLARQMRIERRTVERMRRRDLWDKILLLSALPLFAAYGQRDRPYGAHNLTLTVSLLVWLVGDEIAQMLFGSAEKSPYPLDDTDVWSYLAPIGNILTGWWLLDDRQHQRFIAGLTSDLSEGVNGAGETIISGVVDLTLLVASEHLDDFLAFTAPKPAGKGLVVPAVATIASIEWTAAARAANARGAVSATVIGRALALEIRVVTDVPLGGARAATAVKVAWVVDTTEPAAPVAAVAPA
jgi:hypothetical protein